MDIDLNADADTLRAKFHELRAQGDDIRAKVAPMQAKRDVAVQAARAKEDQMAADIKKAQEGLFEIDEAVGKIYRLLGGATALPKTAAPAAE